MSDNFGITWKQVPVCPVCESKERHWYWQTYWGESLIVGFWICKCGIIYADRVPETQWEVEKYYNEYYTPLVVGQHTQDKLKANELERALRVLRAVKDGYHKPLEVKRHLDVGCGFGILMQETKKQFDCVSEGVDVRDLATENGYKVYADLDEIDGTYDLVTCVHTLEHVTDPLGFLKKIRTVCSKNLFIEVPSFRPATGILSAHHLFGFTTHTLPVIAEEAGFRTQRIEQIVHGVEFDELGRSKGKVELQLRAEVKDE